MTELPPIIEWLDALKAEAVRLIDAGYVESGRQAKAEMANYYEELRALVLRLQEERDAWLQQHAEDTVRFARERDALLEALKKIRDAYSYQIMEHAYQIAEQAIADAEGKE